MYLHRGCEQQVKITEETTTSSSRIFIKVIFQELSEQWGIKKLVDRLREEELKPFFDLRSFLEQANAQAAEDAQKAAAERAMEEESSSSSSSSSDSSDSDSDSDDDDSDDSDSSDSDSGGIGQCCVDVHQCVSAQEKADLIVSETFGVLLLQEGCLRSFVHGRERLLLPCTPFAASVPAVVPCGGAQAARLLGSAQLRKATGGAVPAELRHMARWRDTGEDEKDREMR
eukprot:g32487.t1